MRMVCMHSSPGTRDDRQGPSCPGWPDTTLDRRLGRQKVSPVTRRISIRHEVAVTGHA